VVTGEVSREETAKTVSLDRRLGTEVDEPGDGGLTDLQPVDARSFRERGDCLQVRGLDWPVVTDRLLRAPVAAVLVTVGGVVLRDPVKAGGTLLLDKVEGSASVGPEPNSQFPVPLHSPTDLSGDRKTAE
jgi:hypothetical protein